MGTSISRVLRFGSFAVAPDDASYTYVGLTLTDLEVPRAGSGFDIYTLRGWVFPSMLGIASRIGGETDVFRGPRALTWAVGTITLALSIVVGWRLARGPGAVATALAVLATPMLWDLVRSLRIDLTLTAGILVVLLVMARPTPTRAVVGGVALGATLLVKETPVLLAVAPLAWLGFVSTREWWRLAFRFGIGLAAATLWWVALVWATTGGLFGVRGASLAARREIERVWGLGPSAQALLVAFVAGWIGVAWFWRHEILGRLLLIAGVAMVPAAVVAWRQGFDIRQFAPTVVLSCIALGVTSAHLAHLGARLVRHRLHHRLAVRVCAVLALVFVGVGLVPAWGIERSITSASPSWRDEQTAEWISARASGPTKVSSSRGGLNQLRTRLHDVATVRLLGLEQSREISDLTNIAWIDSDGLEYHFVHRDALERNLDGTDFLVLSGPFMGAPMARLAEAFAQNGAELGVSDSAHFSEVGIWAYVLEVEPSAMMTSTTMMTTRAADHLAPTGALGSGAGLLIVGTPAEHDALTRAISLPEAERVVIQ